MALNAGNSSHWDSQADSGYSVDNLAPLTPGPFTGAYSAGATHLHWLRNTDADLLGYRVYRGSSEGFVPGSGNLVRAQADTGFIDAGASGWYYRLSAVDVHGNESGFALLTPANLTNVLGHLTGELSLAEPWPNPSADGATLLFGLAREGRASLAIYDVGGRRVRQLTAGVQSAGVHALSWDGHDESGHVLRVGLYFIRLDAAGGMCVRKLARIE